MIGPFRPSANSHVVDTLGYICSIIGILFLVAAFRKRKQTLTLSHFITFPDEELPGLSVVIAAKDEDKTIGPALESLLNLDYPDFEIILVEDRSEDQTLQLARDVKSKHVRGDRLKILANKELPTGWLGKVHAQHLGCKASTKPLILLTDADVVFQPGSLKRAVSARQLLKCDHFVVAPKIEISGFWEPLLVAFFLIMFALRFQPSYVHRRKKSYVGIGAFNMITRETLERCDFLEPLRMQVTDDVHLGRLVKSLDMSQYCVVAEERISVRWVDGLRGCILGLEKNGYAGLEYSPPFAAIMIASLFTPLLLPLSLVWAGYPFWAGAYLLFLFLVGCTIPPSCEIPKWVGLLFPLASVVLAYIFARSALIAEKNKGINWRNTRYSLDELRAEHHRFIKDVAPL